MQSWFFLENKNIPKRKKKVESITRMADLVHGDDPFVKTRHWKFTVSVPEIREREKVYISGNIPELGYWDYDKLVCMELDQEQDVWVTSVEMPDICDFSYRYIICFVTGDNTVIRKWETHIIPREIKSSTIFPPIDKFGLIGDKIKVGTGWLTSQTLVQFKFNNNPLKLKSRFAERLLNIKVTPVNLSFGLENQYDEASLSMDTVDVEAPAGVLVEVSTLDNDHNVCLLQPQGQFGQAYKANDILLVNILVPNPEALAYLIDFYSYSTRAASLDPPCHIGYTYVLPNMFRRSEGTIELPVSCNVKHRPLGTVTIEFLIVRPMSDKLCDLQVTYAKHWAPSWNGLEVGHRGLGASFKTKGGNAIRENTVASLKTAAASGADLLEFDVQLSKDMIPVIYHDFYVCISMKRKKEVDFSEMLELPVKDLTLEHLQKLKVYHLVEGRNHELLFFDEDLDEHQPFPTLEHVLKEIDIHVGFNVELKWTMELKDGTFELNNPFDMNTYVDKVLEVVLLHAGPRRIIFSCFNPDICTMVRNKQNKYPVMFLTIGITEKYPQYRDARCLSIPAAVQNAVSSDLLGIVVHTEDLLRDPTQVKLATDAGLVIFCWGDDNNDKNTIKKLKAMGLHAVIYDHLDQYTTKEVKESIFLMEARESQRDIMRLAALEELPAAQSTSTIQIHPESASQIINQSTTRPFLDLAVRNLIKDRSTVTSLESLASIGEDESSEKSLKRKDNITYLEKESQLKEQRNTFHGLFPSAGDSSNVNKRNRKSEDAE